MKQNNSQETFFLLLRAGLWGEHVRLKELCEYDFEEVYRLASEQSVTGLIAAGIENAIGAIFSRDLTLLMAGETLQIEQRNIAMNAFIAKLMTQLHESRIHCLLIKGQGVAKCYERPLWRMCGDIDLLLDAENYEKAKALLIPLSSALETELVSAKHFGMIISNWCVELHGTLHSLILPQMDKVVDEVQNTAFENERKRVWQIGESIVGLPNADDDVIFVFSHILKHFFHGGIGIRQLCDWCRLLWTYKDEIDCSLLESRLRKMGVMTEWKVFASLAVNTLGLPQEAMPFYSPKTKWERKANRVQKYIIETGNFGHNRDMEFYSSESFLKRKVKSFWRYSKDCFHHFIIFPLDSFSVWTRMFESGIGLVIRAKW